jgi:hypothetical protein
MNNNIEYIRLIERYLSDEISVTELQKRYFNLFLNDDTINDENYEILNSFFCDLDSYTEDYFLINKDPNYYLNKSQLNNSAHMAIKKLKEIQNM